MSDASTDGTVRPAVAAGVEPIRTAPDQSDRQLVVIGSSAGGIEALTTLVASLPEDFPAAIILAQHLDPNRPSHLTSIIAGKTSLAVETIHDQTTLVPGTIYVIPPNRHVRVFDGRVEVLPDGNDRPTPSINALLTSAADVYGERLTAVILTGSGSDGASGAVIVKEAGGTVIIEDPQTAAFPSMPRSLPRSIVDIVAPVERIGPLLTRILTAPESLTAESDPALPLLLREIRTRRGIDFGAYKTPTLLRRLNRRMVATGSSSINDYLRLLQANPEEEQELISSFLIKVTRFFRDSALYDYLRTEILPGLIERAVAQGRELRIWSAGCATGEEAYSLALLVAELTAEQEGLDVRIFATDLDEAAITFARRGVYTAATIARVPPEMIDQYFTARDGSYEVRKPIRSMVVFGQHDLGQRPPFPNVDLVLCRNVLIYFTARLQEQTLDAFAYSLRDGGYLVLGASETPRPLNDLFQVVDRRNRVFLREGPRPPLRPSWPSTTVNGNDATAWSPASTSAIDVAMRQAEREAQRNQSSGARFENVLRQLPGGVALVDRRYDIEFINGAARRLLGIHGVALGQDFIHLAQRVPSNPLRSAIDAVLRGDGPSDLDRIVATESATGDVVHLSLTCQPEQVAADGVINHVLILIEDVTDRARLETSIGDSVEQLTAEAGSLRATVARLTDANRELLEANRELSDTAADLREQGEELRIVNAAAQVATEEIETLNEELQATNEELETLNEETQATLEELNATNDELGARTDELQALAATHSAERSRLSAILGSIREAVAVVDIAGRVVRTNAAYEVLTASLGGRLNATDLYGNVIANQSTPEERTGSGEQFQAEFTDVDQTNGPRWFEATGGPLPGPDRAGGVLVIRETTDRRLRQRLEEQFLHIAGHELRTPLTAMQGYLQLARRRVEGMEDERLARYIGAAIQQVQRQSQLITQLMEVGRLRTGRLALDIEPVDLVPLLHEVVETLEVVAPDRTFGVTSDTETLVIRGDALRLEQIALNLLTNAVKHAPDSAQIDIRLHLVAGEAVVEVQDYGPGIQPENRQSIFDLLSQVERTSHSDQNGLGLGLYIAREIAQAHGGSITVLSEVGDGATFVFRLPVAGPAGPSRP